MEPGRLAGDRRHQHQFLADESAFAEPCHECHCHQSLRQPDHQCRADRAGHHCRRSSRSTGATRFTSSSAARSPIPARRPRCCARASVPVVASGSVNTNAVGTNTLIYTADDGNGNTNTATRTVLVLDTTPPTISWSFTNLVLAANSNCVAVMPNVTGTNYIQATDVSGRGVHHAEPDQLARACRWARTWWSSRWRIPTATGLFDQSHRGAGSDAAGDHAQWF